MKYGWNKKLHMVRGLPGEGKSTLALQLMNGDKDKVIENDDYYRINGIYEYDRDLQELAGWWGWAQTFRLLRIYDEVAVANIFARKEIILGYLKICKKMEIKLILHRPNSPQLNNPELCVKANIYGTPIEYIKAAKECFEAITQEEVDKYLGINS